MKIILNSQSQITVATYNFTVDGFPVEYKEFLNDGGKVIDWEIDGPDNCIKDSAIEQIQEMVGNSL